LNTTRASPTILPNKWYKLTVFYKNGDLKYWLNCKFYDEFSFFRPNNFKVLYSYDNVWKNIFPFSVGHFDVNDNKTLLGIGGNFDINRMNFYSGYVRPYEYDCSDIPVPHEIL